MVIFICVLCLQTANRVYKNQRTVYDVNICSIMSICIGHFFFSKTRYMIGVGFQNLAAHPGTKITLKLFGGESRDLKITQMGDTIEKPSI